MLWIICVIFGIPYFIWCITRPNPWDENDYEERVLPPKEDREYLLKVANSMRNEMSNGL